MGKKIRDLKSSRAHRVLDAAKRKRAKRASKRHDGRSQEVTTALGMRGEDSDVLFRTFIEQPNELILATDASGKMTFVNPEVSPVTGYTRRTRDISHLKLRLKRDNFLSEYPHPGEEA